MRRPFWILSLCLLVTTTLSVQAGQGKVIKVLPQFLDLKGRHSLTPNLYERDAYQLYLRQNTNQVSGMRLAVQWKGGQPSTPLKLRVELRGTSRGDLPTQAVLEQEIKPGGWFSHWTMLPITGDAWKNLGSLTAWRATLWDGEQLLSEQKSFLW